MPVTPKPFDEGLKIRQHLFAGRPYILSAEDLNRELSGVHDNILKLSGQVGMIRDNWVVNLMLSNDSVSGGNNVYDTQVSVLKVNNALPAYVFYKGIRFEIPTGNQITYSGSFTKAVPEIPVVYLCLVARKITKTFADDPVLCGINSTENPSALPSSDVVVYDSERLVYTNNPAGISLAVNEEYIGIIATVIAEDSSQLSRVTVDDPYTYAPAITRTVRYNAALMEEVIAVFKFQYGDSLLEDIGMSPVQATGDSHETNDSLVELCLLLSEYIKRNKRYQRMVHLFYNDRFSDIEDDIAAVVASQDTINTQIATLLNYAQIPVGGIISYYGSLANFDNTGKGSANTNMAKFAICNGNNGTPDLRGRFVVGAINGVPATGAPGLAPEVDPANPDLPGGSNPNYSLSSRGGKAVHKLTADELPHLEFYANVLKEQDEPDLNNTDTGNNFEVDAGKKIVEFGNDIPHNNLPPYYALVYIMRIA